MCYFMGEVTNTMETLISALTTGFGTIAGNVIDGIEGIVPVMLPVLGAVMIVRVGIAIAKRVGK